MDTDNTNVQIVNFALAQNKDGKWAALFTAANKTDAQIGGRFMSAWMDTKEDAEIKLKEVCDHLSSLGLVVQPLKPPV